MDQPRYDICGIGNAIVDVVAPVDEGFLQHHAMQKGSMALISSEQADQLYAAFPPAQESSGGSGANTCAVAAGLGARVAYLGKVAADQLGQVFRHDITATGVHFPTAAATGGPSTARCLIAVTPDGQRTMNTYLGACVGFGPADLDEGVVASSAVTYLEGYLFDPPAAQEAFRRAVAVAQGAGRVVALSLSDAFCVARHRDAFRDLLRSGVGILFANEAEVCSLYQQDRFEDAMESARVDVPLAVLTRSEKGSVVLRGDEMAAIPATRIKVVDTTGAGDAYAAGFLAAHVRGLPLEACGRLGGLAASAAIAQYGARPTVDLRAMAASVGA